MSVEVRPARINTMAPEGKDHLLKVVRKERQAFYDLIDGTNDETWKTPTACTEWEVRDVVGHLVDVTEGYIERFTLARAKQPFPEALGLPGMAKLLESGAQRWKADLRRRERRRLAGRLQFRRQRLGTDGLPALSGRSGHRRPRARVQDPAAVLQNLRSGGTMATTKVDYEAKREALKAAYLKPKQRRPATSARGIHHLALICGDIERTIKFYSEVLGFPLVELFENRDLASSTHWFHDLGHGNLLAFFDFPEDPMPPTREAVGGMHHVSISVAREQFDRIRGALDKRHTEYFVPDRVENSLYFKGPDGELLEIEADPLEVMEGRPLAQ